MQKVFIYNFDNLTNVIINDNDYVQTKNINEADVIIVIIVDQNDNTKIIDRIKPIIANEDKHKAIIVIMEHFVQQTKTVSLSEIMEACCYKHEELMCKKFVIPQEEYPNTKTPQKQLNKQQFTNTNQRQYKQIRQIPKQVCFRNQTRCK